MTNAGLITRTNGKYSLSSFGKIAYEAQTLIGKAKQNYWKLKAIDSIESSVHGPSSDERGKIIDTLTFVA